MINFDLRGDKELIDVLASLSKSEFKNAMQFSAKRALAPVKKKAQNIAPQDTGQLRRAIRVRVLKRSRVRIGAGVVVGSNDSMFRGRTFYAAFQEYGWKTGRRANNQDLGIAKHKRRTKEQRAEIARMNASKKQIQGNFYLKKASISQRQIVMNNFKKEIRTGINKALMRSAKQRAKAKVA